MSNDAEKTTPPTGTETVDTGTDNTNKPIIDNDSLSMLEKQAGPDNAKEIIALVSLFEQDLLSAQQDLGGLLDDIGSKKTANSDDKKKMLAGLLDGALGSDPQKIHEAARDATYEMLTGKKNQKIGGDFFANIFGSLSIGGVIKNIWKKAMGVDLKAEEKKKKDMIADFASKNSEALNALKTKLKLPTTVVPVVTTTPATTPEPIKEPSSLNEEDDGDEFDNVKVKPDDNLDDLKYTSENDMIPVDKMRSSPFERGAPSQKYPKGCTLCSQTARLNIERVFGKEKDSLKGTSWGGNAFDVRDRYGKGKTLDIGSVCGDNKIVDIKDAFSQDIKGNVFDIFTESKSTYGHRVVGFRAEPSNQIYVLDPYTKVINGESSREPMKIEDYIKERKILKIAGYETKKKVVDSEAIVVQMKQKNDTTKMAA